MNRDTRWQMTELVKALIIGALILWGAVLVGINWGECPRC